MSALLLALAALAAPAAFAAPAPAAPAPVAPAAPGTPTRFVGAPEDVALADAAWQAARACVGSDPHVPAEVPVLRDLGGDPKFAVANGLWDGRAIRLQPGARPSTIAHEVGHLWIHRGPTALVEGRTELLAACIQRKRPDLFHSYRDLHTDLVGMHDLRTWRFSLGEDPTATGKSYIASFRLFRSLAAVVPADELLRAELADWDALVRLVEAAGPAAAPAVAVLRAEAEPRRVALLDPDLDGVPTLLETLSGTDPAAYDTDGDGWWDGAPADRPADAQPFPHSEHPICLTRVPAADGPIHLARGGQLAGMDMPDEQNWVVRRGNTLQWDGSWYFFPGGTWVRPLGEDLVPNPQCSLRPGLTVRAEVPVPAGYLDGVAAAVDAALDAFAAAGVPRPVSVVVGVLGEAEWIETTSREVRVPTAFAGRLAADVLGRQAAAMAALRELPQHHRSAAAAALVRSTWRDAPTSALDAPAYEREPWARAASRCADGWAGVLASRCPSPMGG